MDAAVAESAISGRISLLRSLAHILRKRAGKTVSCFIRTLSENFGVVGG
jgi:hypothetical protein